MQAIEFQLLHADAKLPTRAYYGDACYDVVAVTRTDTPSYIEYGLGFATAIPAGWMGLIHPRSSISNYDLQLANPPGIIDAGYRGEWKVRFRKTHHRETLTAYNVGERIAQIQFQRVPEVRLVAVEVLPDSDRGAGGFGSSGQ